MATPMEASVFRSMMTSMTYGTPESTARRRAACISFRVGDPLPRGPARLGELHEIEPPPLVLRLDAAPGRIRHAHTGRTVGHRQSGKFHLFPLGNASYQVWTS